MASSPAVRAAQTRTTRKRRARYERRLRDLVSSFSGCLGALPGAEGRYLGLRAGLDGRPLSRRAAARRAGIPRSGVSAVERRGLRRLRSAARSGGCGGGGGGSGSGSGTSLLGGGAGASGTTALLATVPALRAPADLAAGEEGQAVKGASASSGEGASSGSPGAAAGKPRAATNLPGPGENDDGTLVGLWILLALMAVMGATYLLRRSRERSYYDTPSPVWLAPAGAVSTAAKPERPADDAASTQPAFAVPVAEASAEPVANAEPEPVPAASTPGAESTPTAQPEPVSAEPTPAATASPAVAASPTAGQAAPRRRAVVAAGSLASLAATALLRRRRR
jgi:hypothetical protein